MERFLTYETFLEQVKKLDTNYWNNSYKVRWDYMEPIIDKLKNINPSTALEIGTAGISLMTFSDTLDNVEKYIGNKHTSQYIFDARNTPWDIPSKKYDVVVALQVLEHLGPNQLDIFKEIKRITKEAIISLPYLWHCNNPANCHHMIDDEKILEWTNNEQPYDRKVYSTKNNTSRIELHYIF